MGIERALADPADQRAVVVGAARSVEPDRPLPRHRVGRGLRSDPAAVPHGDRWTRPRAARGDARDLVPAAVRGHVAARAGVPDGMTRISVRVQPGARRTALLGRLADGTWKLAVTAPPEGGRANDAVVEL